jgi:hypothetical protein
MIAHAKVGAAKRGGKLPDPRTMRCTDCDGMATEYDHRDYNLPFQVDAVCRSCNLRRGHAKPREWKPGELEAYARAHPLMVWNTKFIDKWIDEWHRLMAGEQRQAA